MLCFASNIAAARRTPAGVALDLFEQHQGTHILQVNNYKHVCHKRNGRYVGTFWP